MNTKENFVYHSSKIQGLRVIEPHFGTHNKCWVYATKEIATAAMFLGDNDDLICQIYSNKNGVPFICERFEGALDLAYKNKTGSIYILSGKNFKKGQTTWPDEVVSEYPEQVLKEIVVNNAEDMLRKLESEGKILIYMFPNTPPNVQPSDKSDVIQRGITWTINFGEDTLDEIEKYHPDVLPRVLNGLKEQNYKFKTKKWVKLSKKNDISTTIS